MIYLRREGGDFVLDRHANRVGMRDGHITERRLWGCVFEAAVVTMNGRFHPGILHSSSIVPWTARGKNSLIVRYSTMRLDTRRAFSAAGAAVVTQHHFAVAACRDCTRPLEATFWGYRVGASGNSC